ncbi:hypothetical protein PIB30_004247 [Stylosanthes scabra]|uniref:RNase H type-1 domain-containing protein n=1 Tax=Stylosanthes scabra TaxID=79078 RepID=A0ABU6S3N5_9FABA|nr:hypothetical protein [Stylosanthes scabra]
MSFSSLLLSGGFDGIRIMTSSTVIALGILIKRLVLFARLLVSLRRDLIAGFGCVLRDLQGNIKSCLGEFPDSSVINCELFAIWRGVILAWECGCNDVICKTDCVDAYLLVTKTLSSLDTGIKDLLGKIHDVIQWDWYVSILLIQRTSNKVANLLAKRAASLWLRYTEWLQPCDFLLSVLSEASPSS